MNTRDMKVLLLILFHIILFTVFPDILQTVKKISKDFPVFMSFIKFAGLATFGEMLALRIKSGFYNHKEFGALPKAVVWGFLGITVYFTFNIFASGTVYLLNNLGINAALNSPVFMNRLFTAFCISAAMNLVFGPVLMIFHKLTDTHITKHKGSMKALKIPMNTVEAFNSIDWNIMWGFVFKKTIPLFWIPVHTITFLLPAEFRVLFAAFLSMVLGVILATAAQKQKALTS